MSNNDQPNQTTKKPPYRTMLALGRVFAAEIEGRLPFQSKAKILGDLVADGLLLPMEKTFGASRCAVTVTGYELSHAGRVLYCSNCEDADV